MTGSVTFTPSEADYVAANRLWLVRSSQQRLIFWTGIAGALLACGNIVFGLQVRRLTLGDAISDSGIMLIFAVVAIGMMPLNWAIVPRSVRRMFLQRRTLASPTICRWNAGSIVFESGAGSIVIELQGLHRWIADESVFCFLVSDRAMNVLPTRVLSMSEREDLRDTIEAFLPSRR